MGGRSWVQIWPKFYYCNCCAVCTIVSHITAIYRESTTFWEKVVYVRQYSGEKLCASVVQAPTVFIKYTRVCNEYAWRTRFSVYHRVVPSRSMKDWFTDSYVRFQERPLLSKDREGGMFVPHSFGCILFLSIRKYNLYIAGFIDMLTTIFNTKTTMHSLMHSHLYTASQWATRVCVTSDTSDLYV